MTGSEASKLLFSSSEVAPSPNLDRKIITVDCRRVSTIPYATHKRMLNSFFAADMGGKILESAKKRTDGFYFRTRWNLHVNHTAKKRVFEPFFEFLSKRHSVIVDNALHPCVRRRSSQRPLLSRYDCFFEKGEIIYGKIYLFSTTSAVRTPIFYVFLTPACFASRQNSP